MSSTVDFKFRVWVNPEMGDPPEIEVWYDGIEPTDCKTGFVSEWAEEAMLNEDFWSLFDLDKEKYWQVVGDARIEGHFDHYGEYDEWVSVLRFEKAEVSEKWVDHMHSLTLDECNPNNASK